MSANSDYYVPEQSPWPIVASLGMFVTALGAVFFIQQSTDTVERAGSWGWLVLLAGIAILIYMMFGWFGAVVRESMAGMMSEKMDRSYRMGMVWFIFSEVMFFAAFFGALFYTRWFAVPWMGGEGDGYWTHEVLWPQFQAMWPLLETPGGATTTAMGAWGIPALNTLILLSSGVTLTFAHHAVKQQRQTPTVLWLAATVALGAIFMGFQALEYYEAYSHMGLTLGAGIYGSTFFMLTGFHGMHVTIGAIMLAVMLIRAAKGHFSPEHHFGFEAAAWYWHFVDVVWLFLFVCVYWM